MYVELLNLTLLCASLWHLQAPSIMQVILSWYLSYYLLQLLILYFILNAMFEGTVY